MPLCAVFVQFGSSGDNRMATLKLTADDERQLLAEKPALKQIYDTQVRQDPEPGWRREAGWEKELLVQQLLAFRSWCVARCGWAMLATQLQQALRCSHPGCNLAFAYIFSEVCCLCFMHTSSLHALRLFLGCHVCIGWLRGQQGGVLGAVLQVSAVRWWVAQNATVQYMF